MKSLSSLILFGLLAVSPSRAGNAHHYPQPQQPLELSQGRSAISIQQNLPQISQPPQQHFVLTQPQQQRQPQYYYVQPTQPAPPVYQAPLPEVSVRSSAHTFQPNPPQQITLAQIQPQGLPAPQSVGLNTINQQSISQHIHALPSQQFGSQPQPASQVVSIPYQQQVHQIQQYSIPTQHEVSLSHAQPQLLVQPQQPQQIIPAPQPLPVVRSEHLHQQAPLITKHVYFHVAPEDTETQSEVIPVPQPPKKHYKIIFIKAPSYTSQQRAIIPAPQAVDEKTLVYVLVKNPEQHQDISFAPPAPVQPSKPEVYFIKYNTNKGIIQGQPQPLPQPVGPSVDIGEISSAGALPIVEDARSSQPVTSVSGVSEELSTPARSYGPPGHQKKRNA